MRALGSYEPGAVRTVLLVNGPGAGVDPDALDHFRREWERSLSLSLRTAWCASTSELASTLEEASEIADAVVANPGTASLPDLQSLGAPPCVLVWFSGGGGYLGTGDDDPNIDRIVGRGIDGYRWAIRHLVSRSAWPVSTYRYGDHEDSVGDLRLPAGDGPHPVVVTIHGGGWKQRWQRDLMAPMAVDLALRGFATWNIEFRRLGGSGGWPTTFDDVDAAIAALSEVASDVELDLDRVCFLGHSSGGHLALLAAARGQTALRPALVVSIAGIPDLVEAARRELIGGENIAARLLGGLPDDVPDRYAECSPAALVPLGCSQLLIQGLADYVVDLIDLNRAYARAAHAAGDPVRLIELPSVAHLEPIEPTTDAWHRVATEIDAML